MTEELGYSFV